MSIFFLSFFALTLHTVSFVSQIQISVVYTFGDKNGKTIRFKFLQMIGIFDCQSFHFSLTWWGENRIENQIWKHLNWCLECYHLYFMFFTSFLFLYELLLMTHKLHFKPMINNYVHETHDFNMCILSLNIIEIMNSNIITLWGL